MRKRGNWAFKDLEKATEEVQEGKLSIRGAAIKYDIVHDHASLKVKGGVMSRYITCINKRRRGGVSTVGDKDVTNRLWPV